MPALPANWIESTPEWKACFGLIDAEEYLRLTAHYAVPWFHTDEYRANRVEKNKQMWERRRAKVKPSE